MADVVEVDTAGVVAGALAAGVLTLGAVPAELVVVVVLLLPQLPAVTASIVTAAVSSSAGERGDRCLARAKLWRPGGSLWAVPGVRCRRMMAVLSPNLNVAQPPAVPSKACSPRMRLPAAAGPTCCAAIDV